MIPKFCTSHWTQYSSLTPAIEHNIQALHQPLAQYPSFALSIEHNISVMPPLGMISKPRASHWRTTQASRQPSSAILALRHHWARYPSLAPAIGRDIHASGQPLVGYSSIAPAIGPNIQVSCKPLSTIFNHCAAIGPDTQALRQPLGAIFKPCTSHRV